jgi:ABC-type transport system involved in cytochrome bd biosynthesis fused ATPase/permease subunit
MGLVAQDLTFRYPKADKDVLHGINLSIPPGTTLAIVGVNGGGKTTLVKALMGLYSHQGSLLLNNLPIASYDPATLHRRMSCLFQDFCKYSFTLRENVGIGSVDKMNDDELLKEAMALGGASGVLDRVGMDGMLNRNGVPDASAGDDIQFKPANKPQMAPKGSRDELTTRLRRAFARAGAPGGTSKSASTIMPLLPGPEYEPMSAVPLANLDVPSSEDVPPADAPQAQEQHAGLSGGQWQRLSLARAFMRASEADLVVFE